MIARLKGRIEALDTDTAIIDVGGVGYLVFCPARTLARLAIGSAAALWVETVVREDAILLYGFLDAEEKTWFRRLTTVQGVGAKVALGLLSVLAPDALMRAIAAGDKAALGRASGVGPKLAARILSELKDKVGGFIAPLPAGVAAPSRAAAAADPRAALAEDAVSALVNLGYAPSDAFGVVAAVISAAGETLPGVETVIARALKEFARMGSLGGERR
ncbi:Holliday junction branch migration protein RuvA [Oleispirillum naphthae]|uniref:Holliday junction branch migration protein RuvA n=1 Tax=Oleispirillum naphthae TaxID=2838853 RepID=UPI00308268A6